MRIEDELDAIEAAAVAVVQDHARSTEERRAASREIRLCTAVRRLGGHVAVVQHERDVLRAERDRLQARIAELEAGAAADADPTVVSIPVADVRWSMFLTEFWVAAALYPTRHLLDDFLTHAEALAAAQAYAERVQHVLTAAGELA